MRRLLFLTCVALHFVTPSATAACQYTFFQPFYNIPNPPYQPPPAHRALALTDPAGEQTALFSLEWGGALASLQYNGREFLWGHAPGAMVQVATFGPGGRFINGVYNVDCQYNPTQAGDAHGENSMIGGSCTDTTVTITAAAIHFNNKPAGQPPDNAYVKLRPVRDGQPFTANWASPHIVTTKARFVPTNSAAAPRYYLELTTHYTNIDTQESYGYNISHPTYTAVDLSTIAHYPATCFRPTVATGCHISATSVLKRMSLSQLKI